MIVKQHGQVLINTFRRIYFTLTEETLKLSIGNDPGRCPERGAHLSVDTVFTGSLHATHYENGETIGLIEFMIAHGTAQVLVLRSLGLHVLFIFNLFYL